MWKAISVLPDAPEHSYSTGKLYHKSQGTKHGGYKPHLNISRPEQNCWHFPDIFKNIFFRENVCIFISTVHRGQTDNKPV